MGAQHVKTEHHRIILRGDVTDSKEVTEGLTHLLVVDIDESVVHPVVREGLVVCTLILCDLVFVVREDEVLTTGMDVETAATVLRSHDTALGVPARTTLAPWRLPVRLTVLLRLPEYEIGRGTLALLTGHLQITETGLQLIDVLVAQLSVAAEGGRIEINRAVCSDIGIAILDQGLDQIDHSLNLLGRLRVCARRLDVHRIHVLLDLGDVLLRDLAAAHALFDGLLDDLVVDIGIV